MAAPLTAAAALRLGRGISHRRALLLSPLLLRRCCLSPPPGAAPRCLSSAAHPPPPSPRRLARSGPARPLAASAAATAVSEAHTE
uniref:Uncharacterized protein n=1 Tax=Oryza glumipatula TaxID=40148 RepID=A0A0E0BKU3_9ORYZ